MEVKLPYDPSCLCRSVSQSVCHNFLKGREVTLPCPFRSTYFFPPAGDYVKFNFPMAASTTLLAWGALDYKTGYTAASQMPETLNTIKWATDYFIKCHTATNELYVQVKNKKCSEER